MDRRTFITGLSALSITATVGSTLAASPAEGADKKKSPLESLPGKIESFEHPCGKLKVIFVELTKDVPIGTDKKLDAGSFIGEVESEEIRSRPIMLDPEQASVIRAAMENPSADIDQIPLLLVSARILRPEHIRLLHDPTLREGQVDILSQEGFARLDQLPVEGSVQTEVKVKDAKNINPDNCIYAVYRNFPLVLGMHLNLRERDGKIALDTLAKNYGLRYTDVSDVQLKAQNKLLEAQTDFMQNRIINLLKTK